MSYCLNPTCRNPENLVNSQRCQSCGSRLLLRDRYQVVKPLGQGGFGATFLAQDRVLPGEPSCVIKQLRPSGNSPHVLQMARELFEREAKTLGKIGNHPQVPRLLDYFEEHEQFYLIQEYISGDTLQEEVKLNGVLTETGVKQFLSEVLPLLQYIHEQKVIHRDIKPANLIRRSQDARMVLIDFGAVKNQVTQAAANQSGQTALTAYAIGTPGFAPPEQMAMRPVYASDIYALGVTCIYLLTSKTPKDLDYNPTTGEMMWEQLVQVSDHLTNVLRKMLEVSVRNRYQSAADVLRALDIEPYLDSLAQGLLTKSPDTGVKGRTYNRIEDSAILCSNPSAAVTSAGGVAQVAAAIRARRAKAEAAGIGKSMTFPSSSTNASPIPNSKVERKLDTQSLLTAYMKGRRDFALHNLSLLNLQGVDLSGTNFHSAQLQKTNLQGANLHNSDFGRASLTRANLKDANLSKAYFNHTDLEGADLRGADLSHAYLTNANLRGANLCGANLTNAKISDEQLALAKTNWMTVRPNGKRGLL
ncbi:serine/threonine protein kinase [Nostoc linckia z18]|jgi:serine/threonine protein kinase, bacterial|uniref:Serine/threonine-protein kinase B n=2 Tax=Nostoc linckia TaxID=92942 RepID=A0A9Q5Z6B3_NOSLI|nr:serine/threonine-protein kinase [Nostoc linckia]PHK29865.1 serine/threonine protein kinase [Nostoc linckia z15]PHK41518.1 serine/threonine protein kinase [Nostoc linckia z16]PHJ59472.1 serine/threonine protein kinase [Nostoc linckia z1]PHJ62673.1 serine/threonine protein kinase [Nostoc linckia z3]PHJ68825.1 serine/threonine protein kinase [Nostoc linckia z2]